MELQQTISLKKNRDRIGKTYQVVIDEFDPESETYLARTAMDAPEIDNEVIIRNFDKNKLDLTGSFAFITVTDASEYELYGEFVAD